MPDRQVFFDSVLEGSAVPGFSFGPITTEDLVRWACARGNYHPIHYDQELARREGHPDVLVHGPLKLGLLDRMMRDWVGENGWLNRISCSYRAIDVPGNTLTCKGKVVGKWLEQGEGRVCCEIWVENQKGEVTSSGTAEVTLPLRPSE